MCQGVVISLVKFKVKGKQERVILSGIGSHSEMFKNNIPLLRKRGWKEGGEESITSIESDFSAWNKFTVESGDPSKSELSILKREYKKCAGNAKALIAHVKRIGELDDALMNLLTRPAWAEYEDKRAPILKEYDDKHATIWKEYDDKHATILKEYDDKHATILKEYEDKHATILKEYGDKRAPIWINLFSKKENRIKHLQ